jgi:hypothetical protein
MNIDGVSATIEDVRDFLADIKREFWEIFKAPKILRRDPQGGGSAPVLPDSSTLLGGAIKKKNRDEALEPLANSVKYWAEKIGVRYGRVSVKDQKTRWGSCSEKGNLNFNWRLMTAPASVRDYVVIHELCHLIEMNHSKNFWQQVSRFCPDHKTCRKWLRDHGRELYKTPS